MLLHDPSFAIVGGGVFGASSALHLIKRYPQAQIHLIDREPFPSRLAASWDLNKVIRADYTELVYMKLGLEAKDIWKTDPLYSKYYHEDGMFWISNTSLARTVVDLYHSLGVDDGIQLVKVDDAKREYNQLFEDADYSGVKEVLVNKNSGWAYAKDALGATIQAAVDAGVKYVSSGVSSLEFGAGGQCAGVRTTSGDIIPATHTILATGAGTAKLLADSAPNRSELQSGNRLVAAAILTGAVTPGLEDLPNFKGSPVCCQDVLPGRGGSLPPTSKNQVKFWRDVPFKNTINHKSGQSFSVPDYEQKPSTAMRDEVIAVRDGVFGEKASSLDVDDYRICWESITPDENFFITPHSGCRNLYVATGGSFHGYKFLPILGKYVVQMLEGTLEEELKSIWSWDREMSEDPDGDMWPKREMRDLLDHPKLKSELGTFDVEEVQR